VRALGCLGLLLGLLGITALMLVTQDWRGAGPANRPLTVQIPRGATLAGAAAELEKAGAIDSATRFRAYARAFGDNTPIRAGEYQVPASASPSEVLALLKSGKVRQRFIVVPEGYPSVLVQEALLRADGLVGAVPIPREGSILPDSYAFERGDTRVQVVKRMQKAMREYLAAAWAGRKTGIAVKTPEEAIILASIVEKETGKPAERRTVAAVYGNRLKQGMPLQADPTVIYPLTKGRPLGRRILRSELEAKNGYNTYASPGLPAGPIANPGRASIDAVLNPADSPALYFVADGTGGHVFANTLEQHNANVEKWYAIRRARGEM